MVNIHGRTMYVSGTADAGVVSADRRIRFIQKGSRVMGRYSGGAVTRGCLIGHLRTMERSHLAARASVRAHRRRCPLTSTLCLCARD